MAAVVRGDECGFVGLYGWVNGVDGVAGLALIYIKGFIDWLAVPIHSEGTYVRRQGSSYLLVDAAEKDIHNVNEVINYEGGLTEAIFYCSAFQRSK